MGAFFVSIIGGIVWPFLPILAECGVTGEVETANVTITAAVFAAAVGLMSRYQIIVFSSFVFTAVCAMIYVADKLDIAKSKPAALFALHGTTITIATIYIYMSCYLIERFIRHVVENEPFIEI